MTKYFNLYDEIISFQNIVHAYKRAMEGSKKYRKDAILFSMLDDYNLVQLWQELKKQTYSVGRYISFEVFEPKRRMIHAPLIRDKIVQFAAHNVIKEVYKPVFIRHSYACLEERGTHAAVNQVQKNLRICAREWGESAYIVKIDISKFFYNIDRDILKRILRKKIGCERTLWLLDSIIDSSPDGDVGIPLGNVTSQDFANIYLNELDQFVTRYCGKRYYVRYMDDAVIIVKTKEEAQELLKAIGQFVVKHLKLQLNPKKSQIFPIEQGVNAYGFKIYTTHKKVRDQSKRAMKRRIKAMDRKLRNNELELHDVKQAVNSWLGHARHSNSFLLAKKIFAPYPYIKVEGNDYFGNR